ncbi:MAG: T9SS type A sorting domain-containing protein [Bacteroidota bacterium]|nr:T9SS type A sorting domain-containing protein [Bacteroidota bacterium]
MKKIYFIYATILFISNTLLAQPGTNDFTFNPGTGFNAITWSIAIQNDEKLVVSGDFTEFNGITRNYIARLNPDGTIDASFDPGVGFDNYARNVAIQGDGKIIVGGNFTSFDGTSRNRIARLNADGSLDASFNPGTGFDLWVRSIAIQNDGKIIVAGDFTSYNGTTRNRIVRLNIDGTYDASFNIGSGFDLNLRSIAIQNNGKLVVGGNFTNYNGTARNRIIRLNQDGTNDFSFNPGTGFVNTVNTISIQSDGKMIVGGAFVSFNGTSRSRIARLNVDGSLDFSFEPGTGFNNNSIVQSTSLQNDGKILVGGLFISYNDTLSNRIIRLNSDGSRDNSFVTGIGFDYIVYSTFVQSDGKAIILGNFTEYAGTARNRIIRLMDVSVGIHENMSENSSFNLYPNPNNGTFTIKTLTSLNIQIFDSLGQLILKKSISPGVSNIDLSNHSKGVYYISTTNKGGYQSTQLMIVTK